MASPTEEKKFKVLIAVDSSNWAEEAFEWYVRHLHDSNTEVICFHSFEPPWTPSDESYVVTGYSYRKAFQECQKTAKKLEDKFVARMHEANVPGRMVVKFSKNPGESIVDAAKEEHVSMVVLGTRGLGTLRRTILGSVSDYVLHHAQCPVVICNHSQHHHGASA